MNLSPLTSSKRPFGFSLPEVLLVMAVLSIIGATSYPIINEIASGTNYHRAIAKAEALTTAKILFKRTVADANAQWMNAGDDNARFTLLHSYLHGDNVPQTLAAYSEQAPYDQFVFGITIRDQVRVVESDS